MKTKRINTKDGQYILKNRYPAKLVWIKLKKFFKQLGFEINFDWSKDKTSYYLVCDRGDLTIDIRISNHTKKISSPIEWYEHHSFNELINMHNFDLCNGYTVADMKKVLENAGI